MEKKSLTETELAEQCLLSKDPTSFEQCLLNTANDTSEKERISEGVILYLYQAKGQLGRKIQKNENSYSSDELEHFKINNKRLEDLKREVFEEVLSDLIKKYKESIIMGGLVQLVREKQANILTYDDYIKLKEKFFDWPKLGIKSKRIILSWKDFSRAIHEVDEWIIGKKDTYLPLIEKLVKVMEENRDFSAELFLKELSDLPEKEVFYVITNVLLTNPPLRKEFLSISLLENEKLMKFEKTIFNMLDILSETSDDDTLKGLIILFKQQIAEERRELLN